MEQLKLLKSNWTENTKYAESHEQTLYDLPLSFL